MATFNEKPREVPTVETDYRRIVTPIPVPESTPILQALRRHEPLSLSGQPPVVWDRADGVAVYDRWGNKWLDFSSGVLVTNAGHGHPAIRREIADQVDHGLLHNYCFPSEPRARLVEELARVAPPGMDKVFLMTTGSEATECALKLARANGLRTAGKQKITIVTFHNAFHGRTLGAQMAGGIPALKRWIVNLDTDIVQVPFPDGFRCPDTGFDLFVRTLAAAGVEPDRVAGVMTETYQGGNASFAPAAYIRQLRAWCDRHAAVLIFDEVQAGFGRCGTFWGFEHYGVAPDLICCGKGISSGLPLSCVIGPPRLMDQFPPGSMTSTHTGNPVCAVSALANLRVIEAEGLVANSRTMGAILQKELRRIGDRFSARIGAVHGKGLVASLHMVKAGGIEPDPDLAGTVVQLCVESGLMLFGPVGFEGASVKICPPLVIDEPALREGLAVLEDAVRRSIE
jgi:4-aminobutyrate aminotransferase/diaminobutyrate-pyruvate transaminase/4-aminobutyrate aminotransferase/(S)-3-amino-2-methylpropionate transaminase